MEETKYIQQCHKKLLTVAMRKNKSNEVGMLIDTLTWRYWLVLGTENSINLSMYPEIERMLKSAPTKSLIFLHNHPCNKNFSGVDLQSFCKHDSLLMMSAIQNDGNVNILIKQDSFMPQTVIYEYNKVVALNSSGGETRGMDYILQHCRSFGLWYKYGRCSR